MPKEKKQIQRKELPNNISAEKVVLGAMITNEQILSECIASLEIKDFYGENSKNQNVYKAITNLYAKNQKIDSQTVINELVNMGILDEIGGTDYILDLVDSVISYTSINHYVNIIKEQSLLRQYLILLDNISKEYYTTEISDISSFVADKTKLIDELAATRKVGDFEHSAQVTKQLALEVASLGDVTSVDHVVGVDTGFPKLNEILHGFKKKELVILAARPAVGKTAFGLNLAYNAARKNTPVAYFSLEMGKTQLMKRIIASDGGIDLNTLMTGYHFGSENKLKFRQSCERVSKYPLYIDDTAGIKLLDLISKAKKLKAKEPKLGLIIVDYIGLVNSGKTKVDSRQQEVQEVSQTLKRLAMELDCAVIAVAQLNRNAELHEDGQPLLSDLRESGSLEQDADIVILLSREQSSSKLFKQKKNSKEAENAARQQSAAETLIAKQGSDVDVILVNIAKNRSGRTDEVYLLFRKSLGKFESPDAEFVQALKNIKTKNFLTQDE